MEDADQPDLSAWMGKPPDNLSQDPMPERIAEEIHSSDDSPRDKTPPPSESGSESVQEINYDGTPAIKSTPPKSMADIEDSDQSESSVIDFLPEFQHKFYIDVPRLPEREKRKYEQLPGHFTVTRIVSEWRGDRFLVKLGSGEKKLVNSKDLQQLTNGTSVLKDYRTKMARSRRATKPLTGMVNWRNLSLSDSDDADTANPTRSKPVHIDSDVSEPEPDADASEEDEILTEDSQPRGRRSSRLKTTQRTNYFTQNQTIDLDDDSDRPRRTRGRRPGPLRRNQSPRRSGRPRQSTPGNIESSPEPEAPTRRSERTRVRPTRNMRERQEDEISSHSEGETGIKVVGTKEVFGRVDSQNPFRRRHRQECDTCQYHGDDNAKGPLVFCQGCTNSYHKQCLGYRGTRDHLVTKVGEGHFVLQCRRCIGISHEKDHTAPHQGLCVSCNEPGPLSQTLRTRLSTKQEQQQREENGGRDPITIVDQGIIDNPPNIMFRCCQCQRSWHMNHLPDRKVTSSRPDEDEDDDDLDETQLAQKRFDLYHRSWTCKDCIENQSPIDVLVAWRPVDLEGYIPGYTSDMLQEFQKEYLVKWKNQSYLRVAWMPGTWVWGVVAGAMRVAFGKKPENKQPRMSTQDAIPEDFFRIDIVFDVRYSSVVRNMTKEIAMARVKEVEMAYVKYKGLGYEDAIWEKPPSYQERERWEDYRVAYEDYVLKIHTNVPPQSTLRRHLLHVRQQDFEASLMRKSQPSILSGGEIMAYQMEGLNWLYYQWYSNQNAILADEMGLGKTIQIIALFALLVQEHKCWPFLVVVPNSTCPNWRREIKKWAPSLRAVCYYGSSVARKLTSDRELFPKDDKDDDDNKTKKRAEYKDIRAHIVIASYESVVEEKTRQSLMRVPWQGLIVDEGQRLKNEKNQLYECLSKFRFPFKVLLTGTPLQNNVRELFNIIQFVDKTVNAAEMEASYATLTQENIAQLHAQLQKFFLRRTKAKVLSFLPPMAQIIVPVTMTPLQKKVYKSILAKNPALMKSIFSREGPTASKERVSLNNILMQLRKTLCHPFVYSREIEERSPDPKVAHRNLVEASSKLQLLSIMLPKLQERGHRVLMFSQFLDNLDIVEDFLDGLGLQFRRLDGNTSSLDKQKKIDEFNAPGSPYFAFLLSTRAGGVGINLATADTVIILDPDFNPHQDIQALSRAHRIGQKNKVLVFQLVTKASAEEKIIQIGKKKMALDHVLIEAMEKTGEDAVDLESILRHGAEALFQDEEKEEEIVYDSASVDRLLDRTQMEDTKLGDDKSAESQFSFARVWANRKSAFEDVLGEGDASGSSTPNPGIWDKILEERERAFAEEAARKAEALGRGKRKRQNVDYGAGEGMEGIEGFTPVKNKTRGRYQHDGEEGGSDTDFQVRELELDDNPTEEYDSEMEVRQPTVKARPFKRAKVPTGQAPNYNGADGQIVFDNMNGDSLPPVHLCSACDDVHPMGWCRLKVAGVEYCGLCGLAHLGHGRTCPHLNSEAQVVTLLQTLKESTERREHVDMAVKYLRQIRGDLIARKRAKERKAQEAEAKAEAERRAGSNIGFGNVAVNGYGPPVPAYGNGQVNGTEQQGGYHDATMSGV